VTCLLATIAIADPCSITHTTVVCSAVEAQFCACTLHWVVSGVLVRELMLRKHGSPIVFYFSGVLVAVVDHAGA
jgi:hypothetical protein